MKWVNIIGLFLQFLSFWFAAPELLGADTLKRFENGLIKAISRLPAIFLGVVGLVLGITLGIYGAYQGITASQENGTNFIRSIAIILSISFVYLIYMLFFYKKVQNKIELVFATPMIHKLINNNESRKLYLIIGAILFTIGFLCQLVVLLLS